MEVDLHDQQATINDIFREVSHIRSVVTDAVDDGVQSALRAARQGRDAAEDMVHEARSAIKRNPIQAAAIVFGVGFLIGGLLALTLRRD